MAVKRGTGRTALIEATADVLRSGGEVQIKDIAATAGVSHTLIYRHFPDGGKDEMVAEAYAHLFKGLVEADIDDLFAILETDGVDRASIRDFILTLLSPRRADVRWMRLEALAQTRTSPYVAQLIDEARRGLIRAFAERLRGFEPRMSAESATAFAIIAQALPLGITAVGGARMSPALREALADMCATFLVGVLESAAADVS